MLALIPALAQAPLHLTRGRLPLFGALILVALVAYGNQVVLSRRVEQGVTVDRLLFDARGVLVVIAVALVGPLPAFALEALPELVSRRVNGMLGRIANLASYGWGALAAANVLKLLGPSHSRLSGYAGCGWCARGRWLCVFRGELPGRSRRVCDPRPRTLTSWPDTPRAPRLPATQQMAAADG